MELVNGTYKKRQCYDELTTEKLKCISEFKLLCIYLSLKTMRINENKKTIL